MKDFDNFRWHFTSSVDRMREFLEAFESLLRENKELKKENKRYKRAIEILPEDLQKVFWAKSMGLKDFYKGDYVKSFTEYKSELEEESIDK